MSEQTIANGIIAELEQQRSVLATRAAQHAGAVAELKQRVEELEALAKNQQDVIDALNKPATPEPEPAAA